MPPDPCAALPRGHELIRQLLAQGLRVRVRVHGRSMWPTLASGTRVEIEPPAGSPSRGEILLTDLPDTGARLHRMVRRRPGGMIQTRGDGCLRLDPPVPAAAVLGRVSRVRMRSGRWRGGAPPPLPALLATVLLGVSWLAVRLGLAPPQDAAVPQAQP